MRRQLARSGDELAHVEAAYREAHDYRLANSMDDFRDWVLDDIVAAASDVERAVLLADNIPRGSSEDEMAPYLDELIEKVRGADHLARQFIRPEDDTYLSMADLEERGLTVTRGDREIFDKVVDRIAECELPERQTGNPFGRSGPTIRPSALVSGSGHSTAMRRLDESIKEEQDLEARWTLISAEVRRLTNELEFIGRPSGVSAAVFILAAYSLAGIVVPVVALVVQPEDLAMCWVWILFGAFVVGLFAVLGYILWYARTLDDPVPTNEDLLVT
ncbi:hypothetical protein [Mumia quercus]|uniref:hypothetical protein n=1 Tax=Mumia quercus TaxID=2976125 RepID=UPI0021CF8AF4|nr:hypothetical protein [Mumia quercus]